MEHFVARAARAVEQIPAAHSRRAFLTAVSEFERMLAIAAGYPRTWFTDAGGDALRALAGNAVEHIEHRLDEHADRASVARGLVATIHRIRDDMDAIDVRLPHALAGNPSRNPATAAFVSAVR